MFKISQQPMSFLDTAATTIRGMFTNRWVNVNVLMDGSPSWIDTRSVHGQSKAYNNCAPVASIINRKARALNNGKWFILDENGNDSKAPYSNYLRNLMAKPNPLQSWNQFNAQVKIYEQIYGECFILAIYPEGMEGDKTRIKALWVVPNHGVTPIYTGKIYYQPDIESIISHYQISFGSQVIPIEPNLIIHIKDNCQNLLNQIAGQSRLSSLQDPVSNIVASYEARNVLITKKGAIGILSNKAKDNVGSLPLDPDEKKRVEKDFSQYGLSRHQKNVIITSANLTWQSMTFPTRDLMLFEEIQDDVRQLCDSFEYPFALLGFESSSTLGNSTEMNEAKRSLYQDSIIPEAESWVEILNNYFETSTNGVKISIDFSHLDIFQKSEKEKAESFQIKVNAGKILYDAGIIKLNQYLTSIDYETRDDGDQYIFDLKKTPYAIALGVGGVQALQSVLIDTTLDPKSKKNILVVVFGLTDQEASQIITT